MGQQQADDCHTATGLQYSMACKATTTGSSSQYGVQQWLPVLTKQAFVRRFMRGEFGNRGHNWLTLQQWRASGYKGLVHIRNRTAGGATYYNVPSSKVPALWRKVAGRPGDWYLAGMAPHDKNVLQGEVQVQYDGLYLYYSTARGLPMRAALEQQPCHSFGIMARCLLQQCLCPNSYDWLQVLLERYPGHVIEFSTFSCLWGTLPGYNTVFWEVRAY
jgi:hypothetical protein